MLCGGGGAPWGARLCYQELISRKEPPAAWLPLLLPGLSFPCPRHVVEGGKVGVRAAAPSRGKCWVVSEPCSLSLPEVLRQHNKQAEQPQLGPSSDGGGGCDWRGSPWLTVSLVAWRGSLLCPPSSPGSPMMGEWDCQPHLCPQSTLPAGLLMLWTRVLEPTSSPAQKSLVTCGVLGVPHVCWC